MVALITLAFVIVICVWVSRLQKDVQRLSNIAKRIEKQLNSKEKK